MFVLDCMRERISNTKKVCTILKAVLTFICLQKCQASSNIKTCELNISAECSVYKPKHEILTVCEWRCA